VAKPVGRPLQGRPPDTWRDTKDLIRRWGPLHTL